MALNNGGSCGWTPPVPRKQTEAPLFRKMAPSRLRGGMPTPIA